MAQPSVYALMRQHRKSVLTLSATIMAWQWIIAIYAMSQSSQGTDQPALLLSRSLPPLPELPDADPFHSKSPSDSNIRIPRSSCHLRSLYLHLYTHCVCNQAFIICELWPHGSAFLQCSLGRSLSLPQSGLRLPSLSRHHAHHPQGNPILPFCAHNPSHPARWYNVWSIAFRSVPSQCSHPRIPDTS